MAGMDLRMVEGTLVCMEEDMLAYMERDMLVCMAQRMEAGMVVGMALHIVEGMLVCKVLDKQACMEEDIRVCKARILARRVGRSYRRSDCYSLSKVVPKHLKKATRLISLVVFSFIDSLC